MKIFWRFAPSRRLESPRRFPRVPRRVVRAVAALAAAWLLSAAASAQFSLPANVNVGVGVAPNSITGVEAGDVDGDGNGDVIAVDNAVNGSIGVARGLGGGTYAAPVLSGPNGATTGALLPRVADFDLDGVLDIAYAGRSAGQPAVFVARGNPASPGAFIMPPQIFPLAATGDVTGLTTTDFDSNGNQDVLATVSGLTRRIVIVPGQGGMTFGPLVSSNTVSGPADIDVCVDFNHDGLKDLVICESGALGNFVSIYPGSGTATVFGSPINLQLPSTVVPVDVNWIDCDQDQSYDLAIAVQGANDALILLKNLGVAGGFFAPASILPPVPVSAAPNSVFRLDTNADGVEDLTTLAVSTSAGNPAALGVFGIDLCLATPGQAFGAGQVNSPTIVLEQAQLQAAQDQDFDGRIDVLTVDQGPTNDRVLVFRNTMPSSLTISPARPLLGQKTPITISLDAGNPYAGGPFVLLFSVNGPKPGVLVNGALFPLNPPYLGFLVSGNLGVGGVFKATTPQPVQFPAKPTGFSLQIWAAAIAASPTPGVPTFTSTPALITVP